MKKRPVKPALFLLFFRSLCSFFNLRAIQQLYVSHRSIIAATVTAFHNTGITTRAILEARSQLVEKQAKKPTANKVNRVALNGMLMNETKRFLFLPPLFYSLSTVTESRRFARGNHVFLRLRHDNRILALPSK